MVSVLGVFFGTHFCLFFEAKRPKKRSKSDQKQNLSLVFFPSSGWFLCEMLLRWKKLCKSLSTFVFRTHKRRKKGPPRDRRATDAAASKRAPMYSRYISAFDARVWRRRKGGFWGRMRIDAKMRMLRFFGSFFGRVFSPPFEEDTHFGRERRKKKIGIRSEKDPRERDTSAPSWPWSSSGRRSSFLSPRRRWFVKRMPSFFVV